jgi:hypothetical protein
VKILMHPLVLIVAGVAIGQMWGDRIPGVNKLNPK